MSDLAELRRIAEAATPGPWEWWNISSQYIGEHPGFLYQAVPLAAYRKDRRRRLPDRVLGATGDHTEGWVDVSEIDAAHIATFDPSTVLALLDVVDAAIKCRYRAAQEPEYGDMLRALSCLEQL